MDEVRTDRLMAKYGRDTLCVIIRHWPADEKYKDKPELVASLEHLVCITRSKMIDIINLYQSFYCSYGLRILCQLNYIF